MIKEQVERAKLPQTISGTLGNLDQLNETYLRDVADKDILEFRTPDGEGVLFVQQRTYKANGFEKQAVGPPDVRQRLPS
jgi:hypothetical protein